MLGCQRGWGWVSRMGRMGLAVCSASASTAHPTLFFHLSSCSLTHPSAPKAGTRSRAQPQRSLRRPPAQPRAKLGGNAPFPAATGDPTSWALRGQQRSMDAAEPCAKTSPAKPGAPPASGASPAPQPRARGAAEGLEGFPPPSLQRHVPGLLLVEQSPRRSRLDDDFPQPWLRASPGSVRGSCCVRLSAIRRHGQRGAD